MAHLKKLGATNSPNYFWSYTVLIKIVWHHAAQLGIHF